MDEGYLKFYRKMMSWGWYKDLVVKTVFFHCLFRANYQDTEWNGIALKRGQFITSYRHLAEECGITVKQARRAISALTRTHEIEYEGHSKYSIITVVKYNSYQSKGTVEGTKEGKQRASKGQQIMNIKNIKNTKEEKEICPYVDKDGTITDWDKFHEWKRLHPDWKGVDD